MSTPSSAPRTVFLALGSNLASVAGDRLSTLAEALRRLSADGRVELERVSHAYETDPVPPDQPRYLNAAAAVRTALPLPELLARAQAIERELGRVRRPQERWGPRTIDIDILVDGESVIECAGLSVPHPRMAERTFVLVPLAEIAADIRLPHWNRTVASLLGDLCRDGHTGPNHLATVGADVAGIRRFAPIPI
ncbi:MAG: 2-amino-4-hydroxy-6-hydroxymethyldihydropteridine diphosphokinase [Phycisphaerae bacterium]|jgi:2-amino-4-hydroxy-6-hydroxymethyldihydropteridine diphosphokinase|nr:2-amino-4-hydroxy-6-hydroxymethyldihydropteridine diphosphokinase [Phycisphaerae bacterium]